MQDMGQDRSRTNRRRHCVPPLEGSWIQGARIPPVEHMIADLAAALRQVMGSENPDAK